MKNLTIIRKIYGVALCFGVLCLIYACSKKDTPLVNATTAGVGDSLATPRTIFFGITVQGIEEISGESNVWKISCGQTSMPELRAFEPVVSGDDTMYIFANYNTGYAFEIIRNKTDSLIYREAASKNHINNPSYYTQQYLEKENGDCWEIASAIDATIFFPELVDALRLNGYQVYSQPKQTLEPDPYYMARCPGTNSENNQSLVISCLMAYAAAKCGGVHSFTHETPEFNSSGGGRMEFHCID